MSISSFLCTAEPVHMKILFAEFEHRRYAGFAYTEKPATKKVKDAETGKTIDKKVLQRKMLPAPIFYTPFHRKMRLTSIPGVLQDGEDGSKGLWRGVQESCDACARTRGGIVRQALLKAQVVSSDDPSWLADKLNEVPWRWPYNVRFQPCEGDPTQTLWILPFLSSCPEVLVTTCRYNRVGIVLDDALAASLVDRRPLKLSESWDEKSRREAERFLTAAEARMLQMIGRGIRRTKRPKKTKQ